jgi:hypothetical protein|tara:strand:- start:162 stop:425 length:264 start_codon:yes stop_codon:yes gene_type:complete
MRGREMKESIRKEIMGMDLSELNGLVDFIRDVQVMNAKSSLKVGQQVYVVQKTKRELGTLIKIKQSRCTVEIGNRRYSVPMVMLEAA